MTHALSEMVTPPPYTHTLHREGGDTACQPVQQS